MAAFASSNFNTNRTAKIRQGLGLRLNFGRDATDAEITELIDVYLMREAKAGIDAADIEVIIKRAL